MTSEQQPSAAERARAAAEASASILPPAMASDGLVDMLMKSMTDESVRAQLIADPVAAAASAGVELDLPDGVTVEVHERSAEKIHLVLPGVLIDDDGERELTDAQMTTSSGTRVLFGDAFNWGDKSDPPPSDGPNGDINDMPGRKDRHDE